MNSESDLALDTSGNYRHYDNVTPDVKLIDEKSVNGSGRSVAESLPPQPLRPAPAAPSLLSQTSVDSIGSPEAIEIVDVGDFPSNLKRAMSCDSVTSDTSVVLEALDEPPTAGQLEVGLEYDSETADLIVSVIQGRDLVAPEPSVIIDSYVRVFLLPDKSSNMQTRIQKRSSNPLYKERFLFGLDPQELEKRSVLFNVYASDKYTNTLVGEAEVKLGELNLLQKPVTKWIVLSDVNQRPNELGDIMFSLSYLPTAERLTVVIVKARNLRWTRSKETADPFIKVYLLQNGKKISKKKTSIKRDDRSPIFNEAMIFSVPANALQTVQLRMTVAEYQSDGRTPSIGHVIVGSQASGKSLAHWNQMITSLRKPVAMWHPLRK
ncbi:Synaptotagmin-12 [Chamberlinius hualienensis]